jgi:type IV secretory pathway protease TraF
MRTSIGLTVVSALAGMALAAAGILSGRPLRHEVVGLSMAVGLRPGDVVTSGWCAWSNRWRSPRRQERWVLTAPDGTAVVKRVVGLPGETVAITAGNLVSDGQIVLKSPALLAELAIPVAAATTPSPVDAWDWQMPPQVVLDDDASGYPGTRLLRPVGDVGVAAVVGVARGSPSAASRLRVRVGDRVVTWRLTAPGRHAVVAGRLDGHLVAVSWPLSVPAVAPARSCLPPQCPPVWQVALAWPDDATGDETPRLAIGLECDTGSRPELESVAPWRDVLYRPLATGVETWQLGPGEWFVLGDCPAASSDSRRWGAVSRDAFGHRVFLHP